MIKRFLPFLLFAWAAVAHAQTGTPLGLVNGQMQQLTGVGTPSSDTAGLVNGGLTCLAGIDTYDGYPAIVNGSVAGGLKTAGLGGLSSQTWVMVSGETTTFNNLAQTQVNCNATPLLNGLMFWATITSLCSPLLIGWWMLSLESWPRKPTKLATSGKKLRVGRSPIRSIRSTNHSRLFMLCQLNPRIRVVSLSCTLA